MTAPTPPLTDEQVAEIRARVDAATEGPWRWQGNIDNGEPYLASRAPAMGTSVLAIGAEDRATTGRDADAVRSYAKESGLDPDREVEDWATDRYGQPIKEPRLWFYTDHLAVTARDHVTFEVAPEATSRDDRRVYRADIVGIRHPDAEFIAHARTDVPALLAEVERLREELRLSEGEREDLDTAAGVLLGENVELEARLREAQAAAANLAALRQDLEALADEWEPKGTPGVIGWIGNPYADALRAVLAEHVTPSDPPQDRAWCESRNPEPPHQRCERGVSCDGRHRDFPSDPSKPETCWIDPAPASADTEGVRLTEEEKSYGRSDPGLQWRGRWYSEASVERILAARRGQGGGVMSAERYMRLRGDGLNVNRYRVSADDDSKVHLYLDVRGEYTLADLLAAAVEQGVDPRNVTFRGGCFVMTAPSTESDRERWRQSEAERDRRAKESRREWYERLRAEFEEDPR